MKNKRKLVIVMSVTLALLVAVAAVLLARSNLEKKGQQVADNTANQQETQAGETISTIEQQIEDEESYVIETEYVRLYFPKKWEENLEIEIVEKDAYIVEFYGKVEGKDCQKIFDIVFNGDAEKMLGTVEANGENIYVGFNFAEPEISENWTIEEADIIYAMQEDVNYLIGMLEREAGYVAE